MSYRAPFMQLDLNLICRAITKITNFFETRLKENQIVFSKSVPLIKMV